MSRRRGARALAGLAAVSTACAAALLLVALIDVWQAGRTPPWDGRLFVRRGAEYVAANPFMVAQPFSAAKPAGALRVFVVGGSQAMGTPYVHQSYRLVSAFGGLLRIPNKGGIATWLQDSLQLLHPDKKVEVVNAALGGTDLESSEAVLREIARVGSPDLVIMLSGDNERLDFSPNDVVPAARWAGVVPKITARYEAAVKRVAALADKQGFTLYFLTVADNLRDWTPSDDPDPVAARIEELVRRGGCARAAALAERKGAQGNAVRAFHAARAYSCLGEKAKARELFLAAKDLDKSFKRARSPWNEAIRRSARGRRVRVIDLEKTMSRYAADGIPGFDLFLDYCHFTLRANRLAAYEIATFYARENAFPAEKSEALKALTAVPIRWPLGRLYALKAIQWARFKLAAALRGVEDPNAAAVANGYVERALSDYTLVSGVIDLVRDDRRDPNAWEEPK